MTSCGKKVIADSVYRNVPKDLRRKVYNLGFVDMDHSRSRNKGETLEARAALLGSDPEHFFPDEWILTGAEYSEHPMSCICGQAGIKKCYVLTNENTNIAITVGGSCLKSHFLKKPHEELIDFSKNHAKPHVWLGHKYDAFIFSVLGFKKSQCYFQHRKSGEDVPVQQNAALKERLSESLYAFNYAKWQERLERGERLLKVLSKKSASKGALTFEDNDSLERYTATIGTKRKVIFQSDRKIPSHIKKNIALLERIQDESAELLDKRNIFFQSVYDTFLEELENVKRLCDVLKNDFTLAQKQHSERLKMSAETKQDKRKGLKSPNKKSKKMQKYEAKLDKLWKEHQKEKERD